MDWSWPIDPQGYDRFPKLRSNEIAELTHLASRQRPYGHFPQHTKDTLLRFTQPLDDVMAAINAPKQPRAGVLTVALMEMHRRESTFWSWSADDWYEILCSSTHAFRNRYRHTSGHSRQMLAAGIYLLQLFDDFRKLGIIDRTALACRIFGRSRVEDAIGRVVNVAVSWGYGRFQAKDLQWAVSTALLANKSPHLEDLTLNLLDKEQAVTSIDYRRSSIAVLSRVLTDLGIVSHPLVKVSGAAKVNAITNGVDPAWVGWVERWHNTSTLQNNTRYRHFGNLMKTGRWVTNQHPECTSPENWTRDLCAEWVALVCRMTIGEWILADRKAQKNRGNPLSAKARAHLLSSLSTFFRDIQEWGWIPRRFDPRRCLAAPRSLRALIGPKPRIIDDDVWAKLLWAGINLEQSDLTRNDLGGHYYPLTMVKALTVVWLFCGLRVNEIRRLPVGCTREQWNASDDSKAAVCNLDVPVNKTGQAFTKPVDQVVGESVRAWEAVRPQQPAALDEKTGEMVHFLFVFRSKRIAKNYINRSLVPILCKKAGVPDKDARGAITSHRARSTIASQLFNAKEPMSLFELQRWLGHKWANSTQHYLDISPTKLAQSFRNAGYFARNVRAIEVLIDREVVMSGKAAQEPWRFYDLGHGYCAYDFFDQCPHRMACAKCNFYLPKGSSQALLMEGKAHLIRMRQDIPLNEAELEAVDDGVFALDRLLAQLADVPTPEGPTPRELQDARLVQISTISMNGSSNEANVG